MDGDGGAATTSASNPTKELLSLCAGILCFPTSYTTHVIRPSSCTTPTESCGGSAGEGEQNGGDQHGAEPGRAPPLSEPSRAIQRGGGGGVSHLVWPTAEAASALRLHHIQACVARGADVGAPITVSEFARAIMELPLCVSSASRNTLEHASRCSSSSRSEGSGAAQLEESDWSSSLEAPSSSSSTSSSFSLSDVVSASLQKDESPPTSHQKMHSNGEREGIGKVPSTLQHQKDGVHEEVPNECSFNEKISHKSLDSRLRLTSPQPHGVARRGGRRARDAPRKSALCRGLHRHCGRSKTRTQSKALSPRTRQVLQRLEGPGQQTAKPLLYLLVEAVGAIALMEEAEVAEVAREATGSPPSKCSSCPFCDTTTGSQKKAAADSPRQTRVTSLPPLGFFALITRYAAEGKEGSVVPLERSAATPYDIVQLTQEVEAVDVRSASLSWKPRKELFSPPKESIRVIHRESSTLIKEETQATAGTTPPVRVRRTIRRSWALVALIQTLLGHPLPGSPTTSSLVFLNGGKHTSHHDDGEEEPETGDCTLRNGSNRKEKMQREGNRGEGQRHQKKNPQEEQLVKDNNKSSPNAVPSPEPFQDSPMAVLKGIDFTHMADPYYGQNIVHMLCDGTIPHAHTAAMLAALVCRVVVNSQDRLDWCETNNHGRDRDLGGSDFLTLAAEQQKLHIVWPLVKILPQFSDAVEPLDLRTVWSWDWRGLSAADRDTYFDLGGVQRLSRLWKALQQPNETHFPPLEGSLAAGQKRSSDERTAARGMAGRGSESTSVETGSEAADGRTRRASSEDAPQVQRQESTNLSQDDDDDDNSAEEKEDFVTTQRDYQGGVGARVVHADRLTGILFRRCVCDGWHPPLAVHEALVMAGANMCFRTAHMRVPLLHRFAYEGNVALLEASLKSPLAIDFTQTDAEGCTLLHAVCYCVLHCSSSSEAAGVDNEDEEDSTSDWSGAPERAVEAGGGRCGDAEVFEAFGSSLPCHAHGEVPHSTSRRTGAASAPNGRTCDHTSHHHPMHCSTADISDVNTAAERATTAPMRGARSDVVCAGEISLCPTGSRTTSAQPFLLAAGGGPFTRRQRVVQAMMRLIVNRLVERGAVQTRASPPSALPCWNGRQVPPDRVDWQQRDKFQHDFLAVARDTGTLPAVWSVLKHQQVLPFCEMKEVII